MLVIFHLWPCIQKSLDWIQWRDASKKINETNLSPRPYLKSGTILMRPTSPLWKSRARHYHLCYNRAIFTITSNFNLTSDTVKRLFMLAACLSVTFSKIDHFCSRFGCIYLRIFASTRLSLVKILHLYFQNNNSVGGLKMIFECGRAIVIIKLVSRCLDSFSSQSNTCGLKRFYFLCFCSYTVLNSEGIPLS